MEILPRQVKIGFGNSPLIAETGHMAKQASGSVLVRVGETVLLVTAAIASEKKEGQDFFPLTVDYRERTYAAGKIPGGFFKRETRPREKEILTSRLVDRAIRPLFPETFLNAVQVNAIVLSTDQSNDTDIPSLLGASLALSLSQAPFNGPIGAVRIGLIQNQFVVNPTLEEQKTSILDLVVAGNKKGLLMVESGANELSEEKMIEALTLAQEIIQKQCQEQENFIAQNVKEKMAVEEIAVHPELVALVNKEARPKVIENVRTPDKAKRENAFEEIKGEMIRLFSEKFPDQESEIGREIEKIFSEEMRSLVLKEKKRTDGRKLNEVRPITCEVGVLPRTHGSSLFTRGQTQALATVTLGTPDDKQIMDDLEGEYKERFLLHYNFPGFATGEAKGDRSPGRREIGHGALARRALLPLIPPEEEFPYTLRIVSDILESNGSSSMASVCGGSLALFDAGVPIKSPCAGIAMGLIIASPAEGESEVAILSDIMGMEDHFGDMDFKVAGTKDGITALQMDIKIEGVSLEVIKKAVAQAREGRLHILEHMNRLITSPRSSLSTFAPKMTVINIPVEKIGALIGPGGKNIRRIIEESGAEVNVDDDGKVFISGIDSAKVDMAKNMVEGVVAEVEVGKTYKGKVTRLMNFGAFVEVLPGKEGLVHISQLANERVERVEDVLKEGDEITVKCIEIDQQGRVNLSLKALLAGYVPESRPPRSSERSREPRRFRH
ncbi:MAG: polyribonucleotide nucleotidyltransferase [Elusimicrobia bacterium]|nr:polyribonucleotide nucleotidyltransferase [Elusimicrobiota bacterium]MBI3013431.1 polyribonucleotide nucleotidyltransferase [Elusimicrobiota bacterium]MBI4217685.1 polyribonucleotide nucleotidyltransferase [Elusimicrobiota bacterium]